MREWISISILSLDFQFFTFFSHPKSSKFYVITVYSFFFHALRIINHLLVQQCKHKGGCVLFVYYSQFDSLISITRPSMYWCSAQLEAKSEQLNFISKRFIWIPTNSNSQKKGWKWQILHRLKLTEVLTFRMIEMIEKITAGLTEFSLQTENFHPCKSMVTWVISYFEWFKEIQMSTESNWIK